MMMHLVCIKRGKRLPKQRNVCGSIRLPTEIVIKFESENVIKSNSFENIYGFSWRLIYFKTEKLRRQSSYQRLSLIFTNLQHLFIKALEYSIMQSRIVVRFEWMLLLLISPKIVIRTDISSPIVGITWPHFH